MKSGKLVKIERKFLFSILKLFFYDSHQKRSAKKNLAKKFVQNENFCHREE